MSFLGLAFYSMVLIGAFAVRSAAGFGAVLIAVPMLAFVLPLSTAVSVATALTIVTSAHQVSRDWRHIAWRQFAVLSLYTMIGIGFGFYLIKTIDQNTLRRGLGAFLILYSVYVLRTGGTPPALRVRWHSALAAGAGLVGGFLGALFGGGVGPIYAVYFRIVRLEKQVFRATMSTVMLVGSAARIAGYTSLGFYGLSTIGLLALGLPLVFVGSWLGDRLVHGLDPAMFGWLVGGLVLLSGVALLLR